MSRANDPAYPCPTGDSGYGGLTIREHFAAMAMQGLIASMTDVGVDEALTAKLAVIQADALIAELAKEKPNAA